MLESTIITAHPNFSLADNPILDARLITIAINYTKIIKTTLYNSHKETYICMQVCKIIKTPITQPN